MPYKRQQDSNAVNSCSALSPYRRPMTKSFSPKAAAAAAAAEKKPLSIRGAVPLCAAAKTENYVYTSFNQTSLLPTTSVQMFVNLCRSSNITM